VGRNERFGLVMLVLMWLSRSRDIPGHGVGMGVC